VSPALVEGLWATGYVAAFALSIPAFLALLRFLTPTGSDDMADLATNVTDEIDARERGDARPDGGPPTPLALGGGLGGAGLSLVFLEDHGGSDDPVGPADDGISRIPVAEACQDVPARDPQSATIWRPGDVVDFDNGKARYEGVRLARPRERRPGWWKTEISGVDLHEVYFKKTD
jgi:hypothetical protein